MKILSKIFLICSLNLLFSHNGYSLELSYQGKISLNENEGEQFDAASGYFKFAIIDSSGSKTFWSNDMSSIAGSEPESSIVIPFPQRNGNFQVSLGASEMSPIPDSTFENSNTFLRMWFSENGANFERLEPDEKIAAAAYSFRSKVAENLIDKSLSLGKLSEEFSGLTLVSDKKEDLRLKELGFVRFGEISAKPWIEASTFNAPSPIVNHTSVSYKGSDSGCKILIWGGSALDNFYSNRGWIYDSNADSWQDITILDSPEARIDHSATIFDNRMLIIGGVNNNGELLNDGGVYHINGDYWDILKPDKRTFTKRRYHTTTLASSSIFIWGGSNEINVIGDGVIFDIISGDFTSVPANKFIDARKHHSSTLWQNKYIFIWGGQGEGGLRSNGAFYDIEKKEWLEFISSNESPSARFKHSALNLNGEILIWGGQTIGNSPISDGYLLKANLESDGVIRGEWRKISSNGFSSSRIDSSVNWTGSELLVFGGETTNGPTNTGYAYDYIKDSWRSLTTKGGIIPRTKHTAEWTGSELFVFGGLSKLSDTQTSRNVRISEPQILDTQKTWHLFRKLK